MPLIEIGSNEVRREFANVTHKIMNTDQRFLVQYYGRPVAFIGPAETPTLAAQAASLIEDGSPQALAEARRLLRRIAGDPPDAGRSPDHL